MIPLPAVQKMSCMGPEDGKQLKGMNDGFMVGVEGK